jgi:hypothetical protein
MPVAPPWFNIRFVGGLLRNKVGKRDFIGLDPRTIEWVYVIQGKRRVTDKEIALYVRASRSRSRRGIHKADH